MIFIFRSNIIRTIRGFRLNAILLGFSSARRKKLNKFQHHFDYLLPLSQTIAQMTKSIL